MYHRGDTSQGIAGCAGTTLQVCPDANSILQCTNLTIKDGDIMSLGKRIADVGYKGFTVSMVLLTGYGTYLCCRRIGNFMRSKDMYTSTNISKVEMPPTAKSEANQ